MAQAMATEASELRQDVRAEVLHRVPELVIVDVLGSSESGRQAVSRVREGDDADHVKILDFGVARIVEAAADEDEGANRWETLTRVGAPIGTLQYMSPQQIACEPLDELTDLYSLGIVLYEMASGAPPFKAATPRQAMQEHCFKVPEPLSTTRKRTPEYSAAP